MSALVIPTYIHRLDDFIGGGFPRGEITLVRGELGIIGQAVAISQKAGLKAYYATGIADNFRKILDGFELADLVVITSLVSDWVPNDRTLAGRSRELDRMV